MVEYSALPSLLGRAPVSLKSGGPTHKGKKENDMPRQDPDQPATPAASLPESRPKNREIENEMICPPDEEGEAPRPKTEPKNAKPSR